MKRRISLMLAVMMIATMIFPMMVANAIVRNVTLTTKLSGKLIEEGGTYEVGGGETITSTGANSSGKGIAFIGYYYTIDGSNTTIKDTMGATTTFTVPAGKAGTTITLYIEAVGNDNTGSTDYPTRSGWIEYYLTYKDENVEEITGDVTVKIDGISVNDGSTTEVETGTAIKITGTPSANFKKLYYSWDDNGDNEVTGSVATISVPESFEAGSTHILYVIGRYIDGTLTDAWQEYEITILDDEEPEEDDEDDELIIEPWMKENDDLDSLAVSLRNDSDEKKSNKNVYELDEEVIYYVDYKNGGKDISNKVTLILNIPEKFKIVDSDNGTVSTTNKTITWTFKNGLDKDQSGTKEVRLQYTTLGKSSITYKIVKPIADIKNGTKLVDSSAVINFIYKSTDTEIEDSHLPYMFGDKDAPTFRPDDTITRAEGALVLTRIFGINTNYDTKTYNYPDLNETYEEARKAIVAATAYGIINGYTDGTYKPNQAMTRAEFMKIIAARIEIENEDDRGFEIKESDDNIKVYKDTNLAYIVGSSYVTEHWALDQVTYLARLNMTSVTASDRNLRLDEPITRAEVAQLVNFYLLRAPAKITASTMTSFSDVNRYHKLFADIVEATRAAHTYKVTSAGTEKAQ